MNKYLHVLVSVAFFSPSFVSAGCNYDLIKMESWDISAIDEDTNLLKTTFKSAFPKPVRMIDASAGFKDVLGDRIASFALKRDMDIQPNDEFFEEGRWGPYTFERLLDIRKEDVVGWVCVKAVVFDDGEIEHY